MPLNERITFGFALNAPFGLITEYDDLWVGRFQGIRSELVTVNANPAISYRVNDRLVVGFGVNYQYADAELSNAVLLGPGIEGRASLDVDDRAWGWNAGAVLELASGTRIGVSYRSELDYNLAGETSVTTLDGAPIAATSGPTSAEITFPDSAQLSVARPIGARAEIRADVLWTGWNDVGTVLATGPGRGAHRSPAGFGSLLAHRGRALARDGFTHRGRRVRAPVRR